MVRADTYLWGEAEAWAGGQGGGGVEPDEKRKAMALPSLDHTCKNHGINPVTLSNFLNLSESVSSTVKRG